MATVRLVLGLGMTVVLLGIAGARLRFLYRIGASAQPIEPGRVGKTGDMARAEVVEVAGQRKLLRWTAPGLAHVAVFWGFTVLVLTIVEGFGALFSPTFQIPVIGNWPALGFVEDLFAVLCLLAVAAFTVIRLRESPQEHGRASRFFGSHLGAAWFTLFMIVNVVWTLMLARGAQINAQDVNTTDNLPFLRGAFVSQGFASLLEPLGQTANEVIETVALLLALAVLLGFTVFVTYSKHLHILFSLPNVALARRPRALGALLPVYSGGTAVDFDDPGEDDLMGVGKVEDFTWKGLLDFGTCTECGRCQSQCPAWNTDKPLSPKLLVMTLRDHALAKGPWLIAAEEARDGLGEGLTDLATVPLVGDTGYAADNPLGAYQPTGPGAVIDNDVLWSCTTCGACVEQCPVDIEHVDRIIDMRRYQVLMESAFPEEAGIMLNNLEHAADPWGRGRPHACSGPSRSTSRCGCSGPTAARRSPTTSTTSTGSGAPAPSTRAPSAPPGPWRRCCTRPAWSSWCWATPSPAPATPPAGWVTSTSSRCWPSATSRCSTRRAPPASWSPAPTASTR